MISIIIPTLNEEKYLPHLLFSLKNQDYKDYEIIISDGQSSDNTRKIARQFECKIVDGIGHPGIGRNKGALVAKGEYLLFLDADVIVPKDFLNKLFLEFKEKHFVVATTSGYPLSNLKLDYFLFHLFNLLMKISRKFTYPYVAGFCIFTTRHLHEKIGGFDEKMTMAEDHDYVRRLKEFGECGVCSSTNYWVSVRRLEKEGRLNLIKKGLIVEWRRLFNAKRKLYEKVVTYDFGDFNERKGLSKVEQFLEKILTTVLPNSFLISPPALINPLEKEEPI